MDRESPVLGFLCLICCLGTIKQAVDAQIVNVIKIQPVGDPVEGDMVQLRCRVSNLLEGHFIEWTREAAENEVLARNGSSLNPKIAVDGVNSVSETSVPIRTELLDITSVDHSSDTGVYYCCVKYQGNTLGAASVYLTVLYFPIPICFPNGPFSVQEGDVQYLSLTTEWGMPPVNMLRTTRDFDYDWMSVMVGDSQVQSYERVIQHIDNGKVFNFSISSAGFPRLTRTCSIGPINVVAMTTPEIKATESDENIVTEDDTQETTAFKMTTSEISSSTDDVTRPDMSSTSMPDPSCRQTLTDKLPWIAAIAGTLVLLFISLMANICLIRRRPSRKTPKQKQEFMELKNLRSLKHRPDEDEENGNYSEILERQRSAIQHTYYGEEAITEGPKYATPRLQGQGITLEGGVEHQYQNTRRNTPSTASLPAVF